MDNDTDKPEVKTTRADLIKNYIKERGISQAEFGRLINVERIVVNRWCMGRAQPSRAYKAIIADKLGLLLD